MALNHSLRLIACCIGLGLVLGGCSQTFSVAVNSAQKISQSNGNLGINLNAGDRFGSALARIGDLDLDGVADLAVGAPYDDESGTDQGAIWLLQMQSDGQVKDRLKITSGLNGFFGPLTDNAHFGQAVAGPGDLDGDGIPDLVVGTPGDNDGGTSRGALWVLFLNQDGSVRVEQKISDLAGNFTAGLSDNDQFGGAVAVVGDLDGDGIPDLLAGSANDSDGGSQRGAVYVLFMNRDGTVRAQQKISSLAGNFTDSLIDGEHFGSAVAGAGDIDGDGIPDLAVGASGDADGGTARGALWILFMNRDGTVRAQQKISQTQGQFDQLLADGDSFGCSLADVGDLNGDGRDELAVGAERSGDGGLARGAFYVLFLKQTGEVISSSRISQIAGNFPDPLTDGEQFGAAIAGMGDLDADGNLDIAVGANLDNDGNSGAGAAWLLFMSPVTVGYRLNPDVDLASYFSGQG